jgi:hypothetical protein
MANGLRITCGRSSSGACAWCDPFARNRCSTERGGKGGKGRKGAWRATDAKPSRSLTTVYPRRCDDIPQSTPRWEKHQLQPPQVPGRERHPTACDWSSTLRLRSGQAVRENLPTLAIARKAEAGPKGNDSRSCVPSGARLHPNGIRRKAPA